MNESAREVMVSLGLTEDEASAVEALLGRAPTPTEMAMFSVMWSEHCSYKSSKRYLSELPRHSPRVLMGPGENAGVIALSENLALAARIESHNHPCAVEPFQGAATGVGGIIRDILSAGARPMALLDAIFVGRPLSLEENLALDRIVAGISFYGNCVGVPTVGGQVVADDAYARNPLVNVMCLGLLHPSKLVSASAKAEGELLVLLGAPTGRDGIGGVSVLASAAFQEGEQVEKLPAVQIADPFEEKRLLEACLQIFAEEVASGCQDLGGGGLTCAASEVAARSGMGALVDLSKVPLRLERMDPHEIAVSETQERMLLVVPPGRLARLEEICRAHEVSAVVLGSTEKAQGDPRLRLAFEGEVVADVPAAALAQEVPEPARPVRGRTVPASPLLEDPALPNEAHAAGYEPVYSQYDHQLYLNTVIGPGDGATLIAARAPESLFPECLVAVCIESNHRWCAVDPHRGALYVLVAAAAKVAAKGAEVVALVDCLNFGSPEDEAVMWDFVETVRGLAEGAGLIGAPFIGGNVSFYNKTGDLNIPPTPVVGGIGTASGYLAPSFRGDPRPYLVRARAQVEERLGGSLYCHATHAPEGLPATELAPLPGYLKALARLSSPERGAPGVYVRPVGRGGIFRAIRKAEAALGASLDLPKGLSARSLLSEVPGRALVVSDLPEERLWEIVGDLPVEIARLW